MKDKIKWILLTIIVIIFWLLACFPEQAKGIPNTKCEWHYINDTIITECGYKIVDGCPKCGKEIYLEED